MIQFKNKIDKKLLLHVHPLLLVVIFDLQFYLQENYFYNLTITSTLSDKENDKRIGRKSSTHRTFRAVDIRSRDMNEEMIIDIVSRFNEAYKDIAAISKKSGKPTLIVAERTHLHIQIHKRFSLPEVVSIQEIAESF